MDFLELLTLLGADDAPDTIYDDIRSGYDDVVAANELVIAEKDTKIIELEGEIARLTAANEELFNSQSGEESGKEDSEDTEDYDVDGIDDLFGDDE